jgi:hypothetical protein
MVDLMGNSRGENSLPPAQRHLCIDIRQFFHGRSYVEVETADPPSRDSTAGAAAQPQNLPPALGLRSLICASPWSFITSGFSGGLEFALF